MTKCTRLAISCEVLEGRQCCINRTISPKGYQCLTEEQCYFVKSHPLMRSLSTLHTERVVIVGGAWFESRSRHQLSSVPSGRGRCLPDHFQFIIRLPYHSTLHSLATDSVVNQPTKKKCNRGKPSLMLLQLIRMSGSPDWNMKNKKCCSQFQKYIRGLEL
jgi:hypothetical protein